MSERFYDGHWGQCLELLSHLCEYSESILLVVGPDGIGKTTMKQELIAEEGSEFVICAVNASHSLTAEQLTIHIEQDFDMVVDKDCLLIIDDAQNLSLDVIAMILQLKHKSANDYGLHIVLFATPEFEQKIARSVLKEDFAEQVHSIVIEPLTVNEIEPFLIQLWRSTHHNIEMPLNRAKCKKIYAQSDGVPGKVKALAQSIWEDKNISDNETQHRLSPFAVGVTVSFGIIFCVLAMLWPAADKEIINRTESSTQPLRIAKQESKEDMTIETADFTTQAKIEATTVLASNPEMVVAEQDHIKTEKLQLADIEDSIRSPKTDKFEAKLANLEKKIEELQSQMIKDQKALRLTEQKLQQIIGTKKPQISKPASKTLSLTSHEKKILGLPGANYTLQLLSMHKEEQVRSFIKNNKLENKAYYYKSNFKGKDWYIVVYGNYANKLDAQFAIAALPPALKKLRPMAREYVSVQQAINNR